MPKLDFHCNESRQLFGKEFEEVHKWLDAFAGTPEYGFRHRHKRHHIAGIKEAARLFGGQAALAAVQHIIADFQEEGWTESDPFPRDELHYRQIGLY